MDDPARAKPSSDLYTKASGVVASELDTLLPGDCLLVSRGNKHYQLAGLARAIVLSIAEHPRTFEQMQDHVRNGRTSCSPARLAATLDRLIQLSILSSANSPAVEKPRQWTGGKFHQYLTFKLNLLSADAVGPVTRRLSIVFRPKFMQFSLPLMLALQLVFCWFYFGSLVTNISNMHSASFAFLLAGNYLALILHELGHASACIATGIRHGPIGFCIYIIFPAFYADVSDAWKLTRCGRAVVDAAGIFMSLVCATVCSAMFLLTGRDIWGLLSLLCDLTVLWNLNPFIRMDGYWLVSDWLGIQNLMTMNIEVTRWIVGQTLGRKPLRPIVLNPAYRFRLRYVAYYFGFILFFSYAFSRLAVDYLPGLIRSYPDACAELLSAIAQGKENWTGIPVAAWHWLLLTVPLSGILLLVVRLLTSAVTRLRPATEPRA